MCPFATHITTVYMRCNALLCAPILFRPLYIREIIKMKKKLLVDVIKLTGRVEKRVKYQSCDLKENVFCCCGMSCRKLGIVLFCALVGRAKRPLKMSNSQMNRIV